MEREPNPDELQDDILDRLQNSEIEGDEDKRAVLRTLLSNYAWLYWLRYSRTSLLEHAAYATDRGFLIHAHLPRAMHAETDVDFSLDDIFRAIAGGVDVGTVDGGRGLLGGPIPYIGGTRNAEHHAAWFDAV